MSDDPTFLTSLGVKVPELMAGAAGGIVNSFLFKSSTTISILGNITVGALMSNYVTDPAVKMLGTPQGLTGFAIGVLGMAGAQILYDRVLGTAKKAASTPIEGTPHGPDHAGS